MSKRFFIATNGMSAEKRDKITTFLQDQPWGYWHWFSELWIVTGIPLRYLARTLHDELESRLDLAGETMIVLEIPDGPIKYWGYASQKAWEWMDSNINSP